MVELVIVVPCFNEGRRLRAEGFRPLLSHPGTRILFVDDGSRDDTREVLASVCAQLGPRALRLDLARNQGKAEAVRQGLLEALQIGARMVGFLDADLATPAEEMLRLISTLRSSRAQAAFAARVALVLRPRRQLRSGASAGRHRSRGVPLGPRRGIHAEGSGNEPGADLRGYRARRHPSLGEGSTLGRARARPIPARALRARRGRRGFAGVSAPFPRGRAAVRLPHSFLVTTGDLA